MPIIKRSASVPPEGVYVVKAMGVTQERSKPKPKPDGTVPEPYTLFRVPLYTLEGKLLVTATLRVLETLNWMWEGACKSGEMIPEGEEFKITPDDFEDRVFYIGIRHREYNGALQADVRFHAKSYVLAIKPELANIKFAHEALRPIYLQAVTPAALETSSKPPEDPGVAPSAQSAPITPPPPAPPASEAKGLPAELQGITEAEFREAMEYAKRLRNLPKDRAA